MRTQPPGSYFVSDLRKLRIWLTLNGEVQQDSNTSDMIFALPKIISYVSEFMTLLPGDIITTGSPAGVGMGQPPPKYLQAGDAVALGIGALGTQRQRIVPFQLAV